MDNQSVLRRLITYPARYKWRIFFLVFLSIMGVLLAVLKPIPIKLIIDNVLGDKQLSGIYLQVTEFFHVSGKEELTWFLFVLLFAVYVFSSILTFTVVNSTAKLGMRLLFDLSTDFYSKLQQLSLTFYSKQQIGDLLQRFSGDSFVVYLLAAQITLPIITALLTMIAMFYVMFLIDATLAITAISVVPLMGLSLYLMMERLKTTSKLQFQKQGELSAFVNQSLGSIKMVQAFVRERFMYQKLEDRALAYQGAYIDAIRAGETYNQISSLLTGIASVVLVAMGAFKGMRGEVTAGDLYIFLGYLAALYGPINSLSTAVASAVSFGARGKRIVEILESKEFIQEAEHPVALTEVKGDIRFEGVSFTYSSNKRPIIKNLSLHIAAGSTVAIIGPTGAGKTTLISLLCRFYDPISGRVTIDGHDLKDVKVHDLRENISLVLQEPFLFPLSIAENVAFGNPFATEEDIIQACKWAEAHDFITKLSDGYDTQVAEAGSSLSGGEKQRICLARAFLKQSSVIILDEPTSALDAITEARIFKRLAEHTKGKTVIMISHRLSTIKHADRILTVDGGEILETGTHAQLIKEEGLYAEMYMHQNIGV